jgi:flavin reductase (DIM6/NTAB) family NADH-FMN oxidoreductase RutF
MAERSPQIPAGYTGEEDRALRKFTYGCYIVSAAGEDDVPVASTIAWVSQASFQPPLIMVAVWSEGRLAQAIERSEQFAVNIVQADQVPLAEQFIRHDEYVPPDPEDFEVGEDIGVPVLKQVPAYVECQLVGKLTGGDHTIYVGRVGGAAIRDDEAAALMLVDTPWVYAGLKGRE